MALLVGLLVIGIGLVIFYSVQMEPTRAARVMQPASGKLGFFVLGDTGTGNEAQLAVAAAMEKVCQTGGFTGILLLGDNFYQKGVTSTEDPQWEEKIFKPYGTPCLGELPIYSVLGNHDYKGNVDVQIEMTNVNSRWQMPSKFYELQFDNVLQVIAMDTTKLSWCHDAQRCNLDFLEAALERRGNFRWSIVMGHHPIVSASVKYRHDSWTDWNWRTWLLNKYLCHGPDLYLSGHSHHLEFRHEPACETQFVVSGGGGGDLYAVDQTQKESLFAASTHGFGAMNVAEHQLDWRFYDQQGSLIYQTHLQKP